MAVRLHGKKAVRGAFIAAGTISLALGIIGIILPILPTTPFLLLAAYCYSRGSKKFHDWLLNHRLFGKYIRDWMEGRGIPRRTKAFAIGLLWITILISIFLFVDVIWVEVVMLAVAIIVSAHIIRIKSKVPSEK
jgi:uncharacterized membrane protein YbaN (DUF454 family)